MKSALASVMLFVASAPCFSESCFDSQDYKNSAAITKAAHSEGVAQVEKAVNFLTETKNLNFDQALREVLRFSTPETIAYDKALSEVGEKIRPMTPQSPEECSELIKLQRQYESIGRDELQFIVNKIVGQGDSTPAVNTAATR
jgi:hypothetical protein